MLFIYNKHRWLWSTLHIPVELSYCNEEAEGKSVLFSEESYAIKNKMTITNWNPAYFNQSGVKWGSAIPWVLTQVSFRRQ